MMWMTWRAMLGGPWAAAAACGGSTGLRVLDPCCGSGTILYEAWRRGQVATGRD